MFYFESKLIYCLEFYVSRLLSFHKSFCALPHQTQAFVDKYGKVIVANSSIILVFKNKYLTCPATAKPSASKEVASQICRQTWNAAIDVDPCLAAKDAAMVTQNVTAITLTSNIDPKSKHSQKKKKRELNCNQHVELLQYLVYQTCPVS